MSGLGKVEQDHAVSAARRTFTRDDAEPRIRMDLDVVDAPGVELQRVCQDRIRRIGHVPHFHPVIVVGADIRVVATVDALENPDVARMVLGDRAPPHLNQFGLNPACLHLDDGTHHRALAETGRDPVGARLFGHEHTLAVVILDLRSYAAHRPFWERADLSLR